MSKGIAKQFKKKKHQNSSYKHLVLYLWTKKMKLSKLAQSSILKKEALILS